MELNWSTFVLECINFLVLVWILKRFLYQPVLDVIAARRESIENQLAQAHAVETQAEALRDQYSGRLGEWEAERREAGEQLAREIEQERARRLTEMESAFEKEKQKAQVVEQRRLAETRRALEQQAMAQAATFSSRLLARAAGPELEDRLADILIEDLGRLPQSQLDRLREQCADAAAVIDVSSAFALSDARREQLAAALRDVCGAAAQIRFDRDDALIAGLRIVVGAWVLAVNVRDELKGFADLGRE